MKHSIALAALVATSMSLVALPTFGQEQTAPVAGKADREVHRTVTRHGGPGRSGAGILGLVCSPQGAEALEIAFVRLSHRVELTTVQQPIFDALKSKALTTQTSLANGSRHYQSEMWIPALVGLAGQGAVLGIFYATGWLPKGQASGGVPNGGSVVWLMIGAIGIVPLLQMASINLFKQPRLQNIGVFGDPHKGIGVAFAPPTAAPILAPSAAGTSMGVQVSFLRGIF